MKTHLSRAARVLFWIYMAALLCITVVRPWDGGFHLLGGRINLTVLTGYFSIFRNSVPIFLYLFVGNILWFVPCGFYLVFCEKVALPRAVWLGFLLSLFIEVMQFLLGTGISEIDDLILNTAGCALGGAFARLLRGRD